MIANVFNLDIDDRFIEHYCIESSFLSINTDDCMRQYSIVFIFLCYSRILFYSIETILINKEISLKLIK